MQTRKLVKLGSSLVVSLPKAWTDKNELDDSDFLYVDESDDKVTYSTRKSSTAKKTYIIEIDPLSDEEMLIMIYSAYIRNYHTIKLIGSSLRNRLSRVRDIFRNLVAIEIMDQLPNELTATEMLDKNKNTSSKIIKTMDKLIRSQMIYILDYLQGEEETQNMIPKTDLDVNRLYILAQRILFGSDTQSPLTLINFKMISLLEKTADHLRVFQKRRSKVIPPYLEKVHQLYTKTMNFYYIDDFKNILGLLEPINQVENEITAQLSKTKAVHRYRFLAALNNIINNIEEICYLVVNKNM